MKLQNRTVLITGGTSGIGLALAQQMLQRGNTVIVTGRDPARLEATRQKLPGVHAVPCDVRDAAAIAALGELLGRAFPTLDTLVNNAGIMRRLNLQQPGGLQDVTRELEVNLCGPVRMVHAFLPQLMGRPNALIVNISSALAFVPLPLSPVYCAAKAGLHSFTQSLRVQLAGTSVRVVELAPPSVETPLLRGEFADVMQHQKAISPELFVRHVIQAIEAGKLEIRPGDSGLLYWLGRIAPHFMLNQLVKRYRPG